MKLEAPADWDAERVRNHLDITDAITSRLDVTEWVGDSSAPMKSMELSRRMVLCEQFVRDGVVDPLASGDIVLLPAPEQ